MSKDFFTEDDFCATPTKAGFDRDSNYPRYACEIANRLLHERGRVAYGKLNDNDDAFYFDKQQIVSDTHIALLINIRSLEQDTLETLLRDLVNRTIDPSKSMWSSAADREQWLERAKAILARGKDE